MRNSAAFVLCATILVCFPCTFWIAPAWSSKTIKEQNTSPGGEAISSAELVAAALPEKSDNRSFDKMVDAYFDDCFKAAPDWATSLGIHDYDALMPDYSTAGFNNRSANLKSHLAKFESLEKQGLSPQQRIDLELILSNIRAQLLEVDSIQTWRHNPDRYSSYANQAIYCLMTREFAPLDERIPLIISREKNIKALLENGKKNLTEVPKIYASIALEQMPGIIDFFKTSVPEKVSSSKNRALIEEFKQTNDAVIVELESYQQFLKDKVLPACHGNFALGADNYKKKLLYEELVDTPLDELLARGEAELKRLQNEFTATAAAINAQKPAREVFAQVSSEHPKPQELISAVGAVLGKLRAACIEKNIVTIPFDDKLEVAESPAFMRALTFASMDSPGPFEPKARESYYYVTVPESDWKPERVEEHMRSFCKYDVLNTSVHEAFPGHFVQGLWSRKAPSKTTKIVGCGSNVEGWAHYCEEMMVEEGLENHDQKLKLAQINDALLRVCRYIVGIRMHTKDMTVEQATDFFVNEGYQERENGLREAKRGTMDPTYLVYTLGKLEILALRDDYKKLKGNQYSLKRFHDEFLAQGCPPISIIRKVMMGDENGIKSKTGTTREIPVL